MKRCIYQGWKHGRKDKIDLSEDKKRHAADHKGSRKRGTPDGNAHRGVLRTCICDAGVVGLPQLVL